MTPSELGTLILLLSSLMLPSILLLFTLVAGG